MKLSLIRLLRTLVYSTIGLLLAFPLSYFFQNAIFKEMSFGDYLIHGETAIIEAAQFGAIDIYRNTAISCVIGAIVIGRGLEWYFRQRQKAIQKTTQGKI